nr:MAG TPA: hypothetical protein [Caudoviricetes sp.]
MMCLMCIKLSDVNPVKNAVLEKIILILKLFFDYF